ncbi:MAG TPA: thioredoxin [Tepidisphaeraceae bacterium]|jgi:thioredoxin|nr:thioredoxin [Tepidisphaeraceae bacterium]
MAIVTCPNCGTKNRIDENRAGQLQPVCGKCGTKLPVPSESADGHPLVVTDANFDQVVAQAKPVLVDFWAEWCGPCHMIAPALEDVARESGGRYVVAKLNVDENQQTAGRYRIEGIPTLLIFKSGQVVDRLVGLQPKQSIMQHLLAKL